MKGIVILASLLLPVAALGQVTVDWVQQTEGVAIALDAQDNVYTVYYEYNPGGDITLTKRDPEGTPLWTAGFDQTEPSKWEKATWVAADNAGNAVVAGSLMSGYSNPVNAASILMKFSPSGQLLWRRVYETSFDGSYTRKCLIDEGDNIYVLGMGSGPSGFVTKVKKFSPGGDALWSYFDAEGIGAPLNFKFTPDDCILLSCRGIYGSINGYAKIDREGNKIWSLPAVYSLTAGDAAGDDFGNTYVVHGEYVMNGNTTVKKLSPSGSLLWSRDYLSSSFRVEVGSDNCPVICGFPSSSSGGAAFTKIDADGDAIWANPDADGPHALLLHAQLVMDRNDGVYLAAGTLFEMAVCKVGPNGASEWTATMPGGYANGLAIGKTGHVYVVGGTTTRLSQASAASAVQAGAAAPEVALRSGFPNPCTGEASIGYFLPREEAVSLGVYDLAGGKVKQLVDRVEGPGQRLVTWKTEGLPSGTYYYRFARGGIVESQKLTIVRCASGAAAGGVPRVPTSSG